MFTLSSVTAGYLGRKRWASHDLSGDLSFLNCTMEEGTECSLRNLLAYQVEESVTENSLLPGSFIIGQNLSAVMLVANRHKEDLHYC